MKDLQNRAHLSWIGVPPQGSKKLAILIPQFNESSSGNFDTRLRYFKKLAEEHRHSVDVIIIDDRSSDDSLDNIIKFTATNSASFAVASASINLNKVGALYLAALKITHEFVILSDFDTDIIGIDYLVRSLDNFDNNTSTMGCYFRMLPFGGSGALFLFQQLEYSMARSSYKLYKKESSVPVMPGAGSCYKRSALINIYEKHSGLRNGEDREATLIGLDLGYKTFYQASVLALTRTPASFRSLLKQRIRWNLGYIETFAKERSYYYREIRRLSGIGIRTLYDLIRVTLILLVPLTIVAISFKGWQYFLLTLLTIYISTAFWSVNAIIAAPEESLEFKDKRFLSVLCYPILKIPLDCISWFFAIVSFVKKGRHNQSPLSYPKKEKSDPSPKYVELENKTFPGR